MMSISRQGGKRCTCDARRSSTFTTRSSDGMRGLSCVERAGAIGSVASEVERAAAAASCEL